MTLLIKEDNLRVDLEVEVLVESIHLKVEMVVELLHIPV